MYNKSVLNEIKDRISIVSFVGERVPLKRAGRNYKGLCPFHGEKTPSFNVSDEKQIYHCFGCGEGGDVFSFAMKFDGIGFQEAVKYLAGIAGVTLPREETPADREREDANAKKKRWCLRINEIARDHFMEVLKDPSRGTPAREYLQGREIQSEFWTQLFLGFADNSWDALSSHLAAKGVPLEMAAELGLVKERDGGGFYDFFRGRLMFPILSPRGEVLGFGGRILNGDARYRTVSGDGEAAAAKYVNSADSQIYHKSNSVYGLNWAATEIRSRDAVLLVEGYMDLIALHQAGIRNVVAPLGTALTEGHLKLLGRYTRNFILVFDGDEAGAKAALRSLDLFVEFGSMPRVIVLPPEDDPDTFVRREGADGFRKLFKVASSLFEFFVDATRKATGTDAAGKVAAIAKIAPVLRMMGSPTERNIYGRAAASRIGVDESDVSMAVDSEKARAIATSADRPRQAAPRDMGPSSVERTLVRAMFAHPKAARGAMDGLEEDIFRDEWCRTASSIIRAAVLADDGRGVGDALENIEDEELATQLRAMAVEDDGCSDEDAGDLIRDCIARLKERPRLERIDEINDDIRRAEIEGNEARLIELLTEKRGLVQHRHG